MVTSLVLVVVDCSFLVLTLGSASVKATVNFVSIVGLRPEVFVVVILLPVKTILSEGIVLLVVVMHLITDIAIVIVLVEVLVTARGVGRVVRFYSIQVTMDNVLRKIDSSNKNFKENRDRLMVTVAPDQQPPPLIIITASETKKDFNELYFSTNRGTLKRK